MSTPAESLDTTLSSTVDPAGARAAHLRTEYGARITGELQVPARAGQTVALPADLDTRLQKALGGRGIAQLYTHQAAAWESVQAGRHTVLVISGASVDLPHYLRVVDAQIAGK